VRYNKEICIYLEYICLKTKSIPNLPKDTPILHNPDERFHVEPLADHSVLIGGFLRESKPIFLNGVPNTFNYSLLPDNWDDFRELLFRFLNSSLRRKKSFIDWILSNAIKRLPILGESEYETLITGADSFTPDGRLILNESAEVSHSIY
jgi:glycine/D-amino acid oxidase-like deaminating enzyme